MRSIGSIVSAEAFGASVVEFSYPEEEYMELPITALVETADTASPGEVIGGREFNLSILPIGTKTFYLVATLQSELAGVIAAIELWDVTNGVMVTDTLLSNTAEGDRTLFGTIVSAPLTVGGAAGNLRNDMNAEYELRLYRSGGVAGDIVTCSNCHLRIIWS